jgi:Reverse transcriptase (RNA-dependent DNA polymerase)
MMDGKEFFEQIHVVPEHVPRTAMSTPDGTMVSHVVQQGYCNTPATCQALMNHLFSPYISRWMDVYLDDIIIYSNTLQEHVEHMKTVLEILK